MRRHVLIGSIVWQAELSFIQNYSDVTIQI